MMLDFLAYYNETFDEHSIVLQKYTCTALSVELLDNVRKSTLYAPFYL